MTVGPHYDHLTAIKSPQRGQIGEKTALDRDCMQERVADECKIDKFNE